MKTQRDEFEIRWHKLHDSLDALSLYVSLAPEELMDLILFHAATKDQAGVSKYLKSIGEKL